MKLADYLHAAGGKSFAPGTHDCCTFPGDWVRAQTGVDPIQRWRGRYDTQEGAEALIEAAGGLVNLWAIGMIDALCPEVDEPQEGDVGVILVLGENGPVENGGIFTGRRWAFVAPRGLFISSIDPAHIVRAWRPA